jgi:hypothetical protein
MFNESSFLIYLIIPMYSELTYIKGAVIYFKTFNRICCVKMLSKGKVNKLKVILYPCSLPSHPPQSESTTHCIKRLDFNPRGIVSYLVR